MTQPDFIMIPTQLLSDSSLQPSDRILFGYIYWMTKLALMKCVASNTTLSELTGFSERQIKMSLDRLELQGYVGRIYKGEGKRNRLEITCMVAFSALPPVEGTRVPSRGNKSALVEGTPVPHNKKREEEHLIRTTTNVVETEVSVTYGKPEINEMFHYWEEKTGVKLTSNVKRNRNACNTLFNRWGNEKLRQLIDGVVLAQNDRFAPRISDFYDLQFKTNQLITWGKTKQKGGVYTV